MPFSFVRSPIYPIHSGKDFHSEGLLSALASAAGLQLRHCLDTRTSKRPNSPRYGKTKPQSSQRTLAGLLGFWGKCLSGTSLTANRVVAICNAGVKHQLPVSIVIPDV